MIDKAPATEPASGEIRSSARRSGTRVVMWINEMNLEYFQALSAEGIEIVALVQASYPGVPSFSVHDFFYGSQWFTRFSSVKAPAKWIDDACYREYALCVQRMGFFPCGDIMDTLGGGGFPASEVEDWARVHLNRALQLLEGVDADEVWFGFTPHLGVDRMLALAASKTGRKCLVFEQIRFAPKFSCRLLGSASIAAVISESHNWIKWKEGAVAPNLYHLRNNLNPNPLYRNLRARLHVFARQLLAVDGAGLVHRLYLAARKRGWWRVTHLLDLLDPRTRIWASYRRRSQKVFERERKRREAITSLDDLEDFVYFPLQYEPEENVHVLGGDYRNQLDAVVATHEALPAGWTLVIKENPLQTHLHRGRPFLERLRNLDKLRFVHPDTSSQELVLRSRLVATITGTAGYESLLVGKPCIYFGRPWYAGLSGAVRFHEGMDIAEVSAKTITRGELDSSINDFLSGLADGLVHPRYAAIYESNHNVADLYRQGARSMSIISKSIIRHG